MRKSASQPLLFETDTAPIEYLHQSFSHGQVCSDTERLFLERHYERIFVSDDRFNRKVVSFQANKGELLHSWLKYREGFSSILVETLMKDFSMQPGDRVLDPFAGSATTLLVAKTYGLDATGIDILPNCHLAWDAKSRFTEYSVEELKDILSSLIATEPGQATKAFPHIAITNSAFPPKVENDIMWYTDWFLSLPISHDAKVLLKLILASILEDVSYTRKDGQYLRWDYRAEKLIDRNSVRETQGKKTIKGIDKGELPSVKESLVGSLSDVIDDIKLLQTRFTKNGSHQELLHGNALEVLLTIPDSTFSAVITSPPYANRYDYTRTYALELAYLGFGEGITKLRQELLSCTVESRSKTNRLKQFYEANGQAERYDSIISVVHNNAVLKEIDKALRVRWDRGDMNNKGVLPMIHQYFEELTFIFAESFRTCRPGSHIAFVNDDVRYGGEIIPVDTVTTNLAEAIGFEPVKIIVLAQKKGNSSQQMEKFGREELRKCITVWKKPTL
jgi:site-specific DNA-methyltransferase (cytosine-N4-specific)